MNYLNNIEGIIFDLDGTLIDSMPYWDNLGRTFLEKYNVEVKEDLNETLKNMTLKESSEYFIKEYDINLTVDQIIDEIKKIIYNAYAYKIKAKEGAIDYINYVKKRNMKIMILTATEKDLAEVCLNRLGILDKFECIMTCSQTNLSKRDKQIFILASQKLGVKPEKIIVFEDTCYSIKAAKEAKMKVIGVKDQSSIESEKNIRNLSDYYIDSFCDIL